MTERIFERCHKRCGSRALPPQLQRSDIWFAAQHLLNGGLTTMLLSVDEGDVLCNYADYFLPVC